MPGKEEVMFQAPAVPYERRNLTVENSHGHSLPSGAMLPLPLDLPESEFFSENREESQIAEPLCKNGNTLGHGNASDAPVQCKSTHENFGKPAKKYSDQHFL